MPHPHRLLLTDACGCPQRVVSGHERVAQSPSRHWLLLGLGPDPRALAARLPSEAQVSYMECPAFFEQAGADWQAAIDPAWRRVTTFDPQAEHNILLHTTAIQLFPDFWAPILASLLLPTPASAPAGRKTVLLATREHSLVAPAIMAAFRQEEFQATIVDRADVLASLERHRPELFLSLNFAGLDRFGEVQAVLERAGVPVAVWCLDNPFLALSSLQTPTWRNLHLFVTDDWFCEPLRRLGARQVHHLPLAAHPAFFQATPDQPELTGHLLTVGRSRLADGKLFFAGLSLHQKRLDRAAARLAEGDRPDFAWWVEELGIDRLWPGVRPARRAGLGAERLAQVWRGRVVREAAAAGPLVVFGDDGWRALSAAPYSLRPPVDYYGPLAGLYASAQAVIGTISLLLPHGLTQRHFDVWAAGGCLLTDATPGLNLFPAELTQPITYARPEEIPQRLEALHGQRADLIQAWRALIAREHTYHHRIRRLLADLDADTCPNHGETL